MHWRRRQRMTTTATSDAPDPGESTGDASWSGDCLVIVGGPAALAIAAELGERGMAVAGLAPDDPAKIGRAHV